MSQLLERMKKNTKEVRYTFKEQYEAENGEILGDDYISKQKYNAWVENQKYGDLNTLKCEYLKTEEVLDKNDIRYYDCEICRNKGYIVMIDEQGTELYKRCKCHKTRSTLRKLYNSGLGELTRKYNFENYKDTEDWQKFIKAKALNFINDQNRGWFFIGGQVGCGKTFISTAITHELIKQGNEAIYMLWVDNAKKLKQNAMKEEVYQRMIDEYKNAKVLYIDDFFKTESINTKPTEADFNIAYEILNYRYNQKDLVTIISSEYSIKQITDMSEAIGSRIYEKTEGYNLYIRPDKQKNMRYKDGDIL